MKECIKYESWKDDEKIKRIVGDRDVTDADSKYSVACAGATNLYVDREKGKYLDRDIVSLHRLKELSGIREEKDGWHIGSLTTFDLIEDVFRGQGSMDALAEAASLVGGPQIRNRGTIGGNILSASPAGTNGYPSGGNFD